MKNAALIAALELPCNRLPRPVVAICVHGIKTAAEPNFRRVGHRRGDKAP